MALKSGYKGFKKLINGLKVLRPGVLGIDIGSGLAIGQDGKLNVTGVDVTVVGNPEEAATAGDLTKLKIDDDIFNVPDTKYDRTLLFNGTPVELSGTNATVSLAYDYRNYNYIDIILGDGWGNNELVTFNGNFQGHKNGVVALPALSSSPKVVRIRHDYSQETIAGMELVLKLQQISGSDPITFDTPVSVKQVYGRNV